MLAMPEALRLSPLTDAPCADNALTIPAPIPRAPPVTIAVFPVKDIPKCACLSFAYCRSEFEALR
jgi:hypothetical protein